MPKKCALSEFAVLDFVVVALVWSVEFITHPNTKIMDTCFLDFRRRFMTFIEILRCFYDRQHKFISAFMVHSVRPVKCKRSARRLL